MSPLPAIVLNEGREKPIRNRHPWIFSRAINRTGSQAAPGDIVDVLDSTGRFLARGYWNPSSQIQVRILTWQDEPIDDAWWRSRLNRAIGARAARIARSPEPRALRLINAESDYLPGLIVDQYGDILVMQALTLGIDVRKAEIAQALMELTGARGVYERSDVDVRKKEGLRSVTGLLAGEAPPPLIEFQEAGGVRLLVDVARGHKTGTYLDQADNRALLPQLARDVAPDRPARLLNLFSYTGGFGAHAARNAGAQVVNIDSSGDALALAQTITDANIGPDTAAAHQVTYVRADVFDVLREYDVAHEQFDLIVCDPPKFASSAEQVDRAARGYKDLNLRSFRLLSPGGILITFSCSGAITADLFQKIVFGALADSGRDGQIIRTLTAAEDHPVALTFPEGAYLKGLVVRVV